MTYGNQNWSTNVTGTNSDYIKIRDWEILYGRNFFSEELKNSSKVAIIGNTVSNELFGDVNPVNKTIRIGNVPFKVIGLLKPKGQNGMGQDEDDIVFIPILTAQKKVFGSEFPNTVNMIMVKTVDDNQLNVAEQQITEILRRRHKIGSNGLDDFEVRNLAQMQETIKSSAKTMSILLGAIASVSLMVGGIGIMNIMLVSVTERTKEIGIRMAIGATTFDIRLQFLIESLLLSLFGGVIGIITGVLGAVLIRTLTGTNIFITGFSIIISIGFSALIGVTFGFYPAYRASLLNPIEALRYE